MITIIRNTIAVIGLLSLLLCSDFFPGDGVVPNIIIFMIIIIVVRFNIVRHIISTKIKKNL